MFLLLHTYAFPPSHTQHPYLPTGFLSVEWEPYLRDSTFNTYNATKDASLLLMNKHIKEIRETSVTLNMLLQSFLMFSSPQALALTILHILFKL